MVTKTIYGWLHPANFVQHAAIVASLVAAQVVADAAVNFAGSYDDPNHPNCLREIVMLDAINAVVSGTDGAPACPPDGSGREWKLPGKVDGDTILVDFTPKGGPKDLKGVWEPEPVPGIRWPDGNIWTAKQIIE